MTRREIFVRAVAAGAIVRDMQDGRRLTDQVVARAGFVGLPNRGYSIELLAHEFLEFEYGAIDRPLWLRPPRVIGMERAREAVRA